MPLPKLSARIAGLASQSDRPSGRSAMAYRHAVPNMKAAPLDSTITVASEYLFEAKSLKKEFADRPGTGIGRRGFPRRPRRIRSRHRPERLRKNHFASDAWCAGPAQLGNIVL